MKTTTLCTTIILACVASQGLTQDVTVQSGEHESFSRLVISLPKQSDWNLTKHQGHAEIDLGIETVVFDLKTTFDRIPRDRIANLSQNGIGAPLVLSLACDCTVDAFVQDNRHLVIDVADNASQPALNTKEATVYRFANLPSTTTNTLPTAIGQIDRDHSNARDNHDRRSQQNMASQHATSTAEILNTLPDPSTANALNNSEQRLLEQIARATDQGLLTRRTTHAPLPRTTPSEKETANAQMQLVANPVNSAPSQIHMHNTPIAESNNCLPSEMVAVSEWSDGQDFRHEQGRLRSALYSEVDAFQEDAALDMAKFQIYYGFGQEAVNTLKPLNQSKPDVAILSGIARLLDSDAPDPVSPFSNQAACATDAALWSLLAQPNTPDPDVSEAILRAFSKLPVHLRRHLGPRLSQRFLAAGKTARAADVLRGIDKSTETSLPAEHFAKAEIDLKRGKTETAKKHLETVVNSETQLGPEALIRLIETNFKDATPPAQQHSELVASYATEFRDTDLGRRLQRAHILALTMENQFGAALALANQADWSRDPALQITTKSQLMSAVTDRADDVLFLSLVLQELAQANPRFDTMSGNQIADRLVSLGFPEPAERILSYPASERMSEARRLLRARIALAKQLPNRALVELAGLETVAAEKLRAEALSMTGSFGLAADSFQRADDMENVSRAHWLGGTWNLIPEGGSERFETTATLLESLLSEDLASEGQLSKAKQLLEASAKTRQEIDALLSVIADPAQEN